MTTRYITGRADSGAGDWSVTADHIWLGDDRPEPTGLYDANGLPLYRVRLREPVGFHCVVRSG